MHKKNYKLNFLILIFEKKMCKRKVNKIGKMNSKILIGFLKLIVNI